MTDGQAPHNELWEQIHQNMDWGLEPDPLLDEFVKTHYPNPTGLVALDIGCGRGANTMPLAKAGFTVVSLDVSPTALDKLKKLITDDLDIVLVLKDVTTIQLVPCVYDLIVDNVSLSQLPEADITAVIAKCKNWLKPGGRMFSKLAAEPFDQKLIRAPLYLVDQTFVGIAFDGFSYAAKHIKTHVGAERRDASYWVVHAKKEKTMITKVFTCSICGKDVQSELLGHSAEPVNSGRCCDLCNDDVVIPRRIADAYKNRKNEKPEELYEE